MFGSKHKEETAVVPVGDGQAEINIFTVASGHLYEVRKPDDEVLNVYAKDIPCSDSRLL